METTVILLGVAAFTGVVLLMVFILLGAKARLVSTGNVKIVINGNEDKPIEVAAGSSLLSTLANQKLFIPSACGGGGTCAQCKVQVDEGGGDLLPTERGHINRGMEKDHWRLSCQVKVKHDMKIRVPESLFSVQKWDCTVVSNRNVATFIKEFKVRLPAGESMKFTSGDYIQIEIPPHKVKFADFKIEEQYRDEWDKYKLWELVSVSEVTDERAYSMANYPAEGADLVMLNVRIATPPPRTTGIPPGKGSSYIFSLQPGDKVKISGPFGDFHLQPTQREAMFIGGGAGMAPLRAHIMRMFHMDKTQRKVSYWYGARSLREMFYVEDFEKIARENKNFSWNVALSEPKPEDNWRGYTGFIHQVVLENYLKKHAAPEDIEYYLCGPPMMNKAVLKMLEDLGVAPEMIRLDDFGG